MKLIVDLKPRTDGTVRTSVGSNKYVFKAAEDGRLTADVPDDDADVLLDTGNFYPAAEDDSAIDAAKAEQLDAAAAALDAAKTAHDADPTEETAAALAAAEEAFDAAAAEPEKPKSKSKSKKK
jgi:hypothetical protein